MTTTTGQNTLAKIGNFVGQRVRELLNLISTKADRVELEKLPRFFEASSSSEMLTLDGVRNLLDAQLSGNNREGMQKSRADIDKYLLKGVTNHGSTGN